MKARNSGAPQRLYLQWHITHRCNLRCTHCYQEDYGLITPREELFFSLDRFDRYRQELGLETQINLTGGEPLLHPDFFELAAEIRRRGMRLGVLTNGTLIDEEIADRLAALKCVFVQISLDGAEQAHDAIRGAGQFQRAMRGIDLLKQRGVRVLVSFTAQRSNVSDFDELAGICRRHRVDKLWWDRLVCDDPEDISEKCLSTAELESFVRHCGDLRRRYKLLYGTDMISMSRSLQFLGSHDRNACGYRCNAGNNLLVLLADGSIMPCRRLPFVIGSIRDGELGDIIKGSRLMCRLKSQSVPAECMDCGKVSKCFGGSRCVTYAQTGRLISRDVNCFYAINKHI